MSRPPPPTGVRPASAAGPAPPRAGAAVGEDPLAYAISWITRHHGRDRSPASLLAELPAVDRLDPLLAIRALQDAGFHAGLMERRIGDISSLLLPAVLLLEDGDACILVARHADGVTYDVVMPGPLDHSCTATESDLSPHYSGTALVATPQVRHQAHAEDAALLADPSQHWFWGTLRRFTPYYRSALLAALLSNVLMLATGLTTAIIYDKVIPHQAFVTLWALAIGAGIAIGFDLLSRQLRAYLIDMAGRKVDLLVGVRLFRQSLSIRMEQRPQSAGAFAHQVSQIETVRDFFASATLSALSDLPFIVIFVAMTFVIGGPLGWVPLLAIPVLVGVSVLIQGALRRAMTSQMQQHGDLHGLLVEAVDGIEDLKAAGAQGRFLRQYEESSVAATEATLRSRRITAFTTNLSMVAQQIVTLVMLVWGVHLIDAKVITGGVLFGSIMFATRALAPLSQVVSLATRYPGARAAYGRCHPDHRPSAALHRPVNACAAVHAPAAAPLPRRQTASACARHPADHPSRSALLQFQPPAAPGWPAGPARYGRPAAALPRLHRHRPRPPPAARRATTRRQASSVGRPRRLRAQTTRRWS